MFLSRSRLCFLGSTRSRDKNELSYARTQRVAREARSLFLTPSARVACATDSQRGMAYLLCLVLEVERIGTKCKPCLDFVVCFWEGAESLRKEE